MEKSTNSLSWMHGLEEYFAFKGEAEISKYCADFIKVMYSENKGSSLRNALINNIPNYDKDSVVNAVNFFAHTANSEENMRLNEICSALVLLFPDNPMLQSVKKFYRESKLDLRDVFSRGQVKSKIWLAKELSNIKKDFDTVYLLAGWYGQLVKYLDCAEISYNKVRSFDIDSAACIMSDRVFNIDKIEGYAVKSVELDVTDTNWIYSTGCQYNIKNYTNDKVFSEKTVPDLIVNTSAEHFDTGWYKTFTKKRLSTNPLFVIQTNNFFDVAEHINCVADLEEMKHKFPMSEILYQGQLDLLGYKRFMLIGRP